MRRTYELVRVDASTWAEGEHVQDLTECSLTFEDEGLRCSASLTSYDHLADGYYRVYMVAEQGGERARVALATVRLQSPKREMDGKRVAYRSTGYSPLVELDSDYPPLGWTASGPVVEAARAIVSGHCHAPCDAGASAAAMEPWTAEDDDTWLDCLEAVLAKGSMHVEVDGMGTVRFVDDADASRAAPVRTFDDGAYDLPSILMPEVDDELDYYDAANRVEVVYSKSGATLSASAVNESDGATSVDARGYVKTLRETSPELDEPVTQAKVQALADKLLVEQSHIEGTCEFEHAFVPDVTVFRTVRLDYTRHGYRVDGTVRRQSLDCTPAAIVKTKVTYKEAM